jgi:hypothetical protein
MDTLRCSRCILPDYTPGIHFNKEKVCNYCQHFDKSHLGIPKEQGTDNRQQSKIEKRTVPFLNHLPLKKGQVLNQGIREQDIDKTFPCSPLPITSEATAFNNVIQNGWDSLAQAIAKGLSKKNKRSQYDCLVACSGGKDSVSALYYIKNEFGLNPLVYTFDNNFESKDTLSMIEKITNTLNVRWVYSKDQELVVYKYMHQFLRSSIRHKVQLCTFCTTLKTIFAKEMLFLSQKYEIPIIISGVGKGHADILADPQYTSQLAQAKAFRDIITRSLHLNLKKFDVQPLYWMPHYIPFWGFATHNLAKVQALLVKKFDWHPAKYSFPGNSTNCLLSLIDGFLSRKYKIFSQYENELSTQIRLNEINREQAIQAIEMPLDQELLNIILEKFYLSVVNL